MAEIDFTAIAENCRSEGMVLWWGEAHPETGNSDRKRLNIEFSEEDGFILFDVSTQGMPEFDQQYSQFDPVEMTEFETNALLGRIAAIHGDPVSRSMGDPMMMG